MNEDAHFTGADRKTLTQVETKLDRALEDIKNLANNFAGKAEYLLLVKRVESLEDNNKWIVRLIIGTIILAVLGLVIVAKSTKL